MSDAFGAKPALTLFDLRTGNGDGGRTPRKIDHDQLIRVRDGYVGRLYITVIGIGLDQG